MKTENFNLEKIQKMYNERCYDWDNITQEEYEWLMNQVEETGRYLYDDCEVVSVTDLSKDQIDSHLKFLEDVKNEVYSPEYTEEDRSEDEMFNSLSVEEQDEIIDLDYKYILDEDDYKRIQIWKKDNYEKWREGDVDIDELRREVRLIG